MAEPDQVPAGIPVVHEQAEEDGTPVDVSGGAGLERTFDETEPQQGDAPGAPTREAVVTPDEGTSQA
jgi:hypothetical protein